MTDVDLKEFKNNYLPSKGNEKLENSITTLAELARREGFNLSEYKKIERVDAHNSVEVRKARAELNRYLSKVNRARIDYTKLFKEEVDLRLSEYQEELDRIDNLIDNYSQQEIINKHNAIEEIYQRAFTAVPDLSDDLERQEVVKKVTLNEKWKNKTYALPKIETEITDKVLQIVRDINLLKTMDKEHLINKYFFETDLDITSTLNEKKMDILDYYISFNENDMYELNIRVAAKDRTVIENIIKELSDNELIDDLELKKADYSLEIEDLMK